VNKAGLNMNKPTFAYRLAAGVVEAQIFEGHVPEGWVDTPAKLVKAEVAETAPVAEHSDTVAEAPQPKPRAKRGRKPKAAS
jgi:hypothetical protein